MIFRVGAEERLAAAYANVRSLSFRICELAAEGRFRSLPARDVILLFRQFRSPLRIGFLDFVAHGFSLHPSPVRFHDSKLQARRTRRMPRTVE